MAGIEQGESIIINYDTNLPRPYSIGFRVQGIKGLWMDVNDSIHIAGKSESHRWEEAGPDLRQYDHPLWQQRAKEWFLINRLALRGMNERNRENVDRCR